MLSRRSLLTLSGSALLSSTILRAGPLGAQPAGQQVLTVGTRTLDVKGRAATVFGITNWRGTSGLDLDQSEGFDVRVVNGAGEDTVIHWHGLTPPFPGDGSPVSQAIIPAGGAHDYQFDLARSGTNWMHSHHGLQEAQLMAAPLIVRPNSDRSLDRQDVTLLLQDFSFTPPEEILAGLTSGTTSPVGSGMAAMSMGMVRGGEGSMPGMDHSQMNMGNMNMGNRGEETAPDMDLNDVSFDAFLANDRELFDPQVVTVDKGGAVRLRVINAASSTNFWIDLGGLNGTLVAVDGMDVVPVYGRRFEIGMAQRLDVDVKIPPGGGAFPVLAQREGERVRTGLILATAAAAIAKIAEEADVIAPPVLLDLERQLAASAPLDRRTADQALTVDLTGDMTGYVWGLNGQPYGDHTPIAVSAGQRIEMTLRNLTMMSHPMHLHGHHFQVVALGRARFSGAMRDTIMVPARESVTIAFDADNPGEWPLHCHNAYHLAAGMMTTIKYS